MGSTSFWGFSYPNLLLVFLNFLFLGTCYIFFSASVETFSGSFFFNFFCTSFWVSFVTTEIRFFALKGKKEKVLDNEWRSERFLMM